MKKIICFVAISFLFLSVSQARAYELMVLSGKTSQNSQRWEEEILPEYPNSESGKNLPVKVVPIQGAQLPQWLNEALAEGRVGEIFGTPTFIIWDRDNKKEVGRVQGYTEKPRFYSQLNEALAMIEQGFHPGGREGPGGHEEGSSGDSRREGSKMSRDIMDHIYTTPEEAKRASEMLGLGGEIHTHKTPDGTIYMPGPMM